MSGLPPNHHAHYRQFSGVFGYLAGVTMIVGRGSDTRLVAGLAGIGPDDHVLDIGCGPGTAARFAARTAATVTGVDPSEPMLRWAALLTRMRRTPGQIRWMTGAAEALPLPDDSVTVCWSIASVHHWPDLEGGLAELVRVLSPSGTFVALEKQVKPGATGNASHGWTRAQADSFAAMLSARGFASAEVSDHDLGRRKGLAVTGRMADG